MKDSRRSGDTLYTFKGPGRAGMLLTAQFIVALGMATGFWYIFVTTFNDEPAALSVFAGLAGTALLFFAWRLISKVTRREQLAVTDAELRIVRIVNGRKQEQAYSLDEVQNLCFLGNGAMPEHPLASEHFDAMGFGARQAMVNVVSADGNLAFYHRGKMIRFGIGVPSWDAALIDREIRARSGDAIRMAGLPDEISDDHWQR